MPFAVTGTTAQSVDQNALLKSKAPIVSDSGVARLMIDISAAKAKPSERFGQ